MKRSREDRRLGSGTGEGDLGGGVQIAWLYEYMKLVSVITGGRAYRLFRNNEGIRLILGVDNNLLPGKCR